MPRRRARGRPRADDVLTPAEWRVVQFVRHGLTNRAIAERRRISVDAVKYHVANAIAKLGLENRRALRAWKGVPKRSALSQRGRRVMSGTMAVTGLGQVSRAVSDIARSEAWYRDVLELRHLYTYGTLSFFDVGGVRLFLSQQETTGTESVLYLAVGDIMAAHETLVGRGVEFLGAPHLIHTHPDGTEEWMAFFKDPDGRPLALMSRVAKTGA
jgi:DNA-binding CsgD family transcriptional regulator/catechol 2,3-dioxygenase-like lactoylglutathione lyase family enzyme